MFNCNDVFEDLYEHKKFRILWLKNNDIIYVIELENDDLPIAIQYDELQKKIDNGDVRAIEDTWSIQAFQEELISNKDKQFRDNIWQYIRDLVENEPDVYDRSQRSQLMEKVIAKYNITKMTLYKQLKKYWKGGKTKNAFLPNYKNCGAKGTKRCSVNSKIGRPSKYGSGSARNVDDEIKIIFEKAIKKYYHNRNEYPLSTVYELI